MAGKVEMLIFLYLCSYFVSTYTVSRGNGRQNDKSTD